MTKSEMRAERKRRAAAGLPWNIELSAEGQPEQVRPLGNRAESRRLRALDRWARHNDDSGRE